MKKDISIKALRLVALLQAIERYVAAPPAVTSRALVDLAITKIEAEETNK